MVVSWGREIYLPQFKQVNQRRERELEFEVKTHRLYLALAFAGPKMMHLIHVLNIGFILWCALTDDCIQRFYRWRNMKSSVETHRTCVER